MKGTFVYYAVCMTRNCAWRSDPQTTAAKAQAQAKRHTDSGEHKDYQDVPLWDTDFGAGDGPVSSI